MRRLGIVCAVSAGAACASARGGGAPSLAGEWTQRGDALHAAADTSRRQTFVFRDDATALWIIGTPARRDTFAINYRLDPSVTPAKLDLFGFTSGFLRGRTLYCIADLAQIAARDASFRMDCEPGGGATPESARPASFTAQTVTYARVR